MPFVAFGGGGIFADGDVTLPRWCCPRSAAGIAQALTAPFSSGVSALLYIDRRMRAEGLDVSLAAAAARGAAAPDALPGRPRTGADPRAGP